ncbi:phospho-sugar mutase [Myceligenerans pegani]|uniref:Phospho-sugar mutase n=1 Tax=Myceligenerans pegani TaxID=2776917 RepID=A0ABR9N219_9MICO|nr:phospho-sugar mutase [Myceligenerans sp. TRM 65318]MBE1877133.1 phospho-sugar mutase [Myceligenerans sp. TRM 65318]MBE3019404.1 phospho-sugar mutase [Myceligenerans sp. TRM 65318]
MSTSVPVHRTSTTADDDGDAVLRYAAAWIADDVDDGDRVELRNLLAKASVPHLRDLALAELRDRFSGLLEFGTAGLRGAMAAGPHRMNRAVVITAAAGLGAYLTSEITGAPRVVVGYDARHRSEVFARDTAAVLTAAGAEVSLLPAPLPTPVLAFAVRHLDADAGVMVTASHNPAADNGYKVYLGGRVVTDSGQGAQIVPPYDARIAAEIARVATASGGASAVPRAESGWTVLGEDIHEEYLRRVALLRDPGLHLRDVHAPRLMPTAQARTAVAIPDEFAGPPPLRIVTTSLHGVGGRTLGRVLADAGFTDVVPVEEQLDPNPDFPTVRFPNPEERGALDLALSIASDVHADVVIANDPDADRCAVAVYDPDWGTYQGAETAASHGWHMLTGDQVGALLGWDIAQHTTSGTLASSVVSSRVLQRIAALHGLRHATTLTGFKWISRTPDLVFGYEEALGYCVDPEAVRDKDGLSAALRVALLAERLKESGRTLRDALDDIARACGLYATGQLAARFDDLARIPEAMSRLRAAPPATLDGAPVVKVVDLAEGVDGLPPTDGVVLTADDDTRVIVRPSGTEPKVKCYLEVVRPVGEDATAEDLGRARVVAQERLERLKKELAKALGL